MHPLHPLRSDRFFMGGPDSLRGFCTKGVGPTDVRRPCADPAAAAEAAGGSAITRDALGGDLLCSAAAAVTFPVRHACMRACACVCHVIRMRRANTWHVDHDAMPTAAE